MDYEKKYKEALEKARQLCVYPTTKPFISDLQDLFPELKEDEDERIRKVIYGWIYTQPSQFFDSGFSKEEMLAWLEKQGNIDSQVKLPTFTFDDVLALQCCMETVKKVQEDKELYVQLQSLHDRLHDAYWLEKQSKTQVRTNIEWVNAIDNACNERYTEEYSHGKYCHEQSFKWGFQEGVEWLKKRGEQKIADKYNITGIKSKHAEGKLGEMIKEMESANKVEPKFKVGDWIYHEISGNVFHINRIENRTYISDEGATISFGRQNDWRFWAIQDAKDGDVLAREPIYDYPSPFIAIYKEHGLDYFNSYCFIGFDEKFYTGDTGHGVIGIHPATKEQRDFLFKKMKEAGYEWNAEKKELKKIEQKPINKVEPKFHEGDWIIGDKDNTVHQVKTAIENVSNSRYAYDLIDGGYISTSHENDYHLWTIKDARDGDVLSYRDGQWIFIYKKRIDDKSFQYYALYSTIHQDLTINDAGFTLLGDAIIPATREQRDTLMKAITDAGYTFDFEKKELKKIEQISTWSEEDEIGLNDALWAIQQARAIAKNENDMGNLWYAEKWLKSLKGRVGCETICTTTKEWSEEDELHIRELESLVKQEWAIVERENDKDRIYKMRDLSFFLKTLKPQLKQEWSEEDKRMINKLIAVVELYYGVGDDLDKQSCLSWLKSIKERLILI